MNAKYVEVYPTVSPCSKTHPLVWLKTHLSMHRVIKEIILQLQSTFMTNKPFVQSLQKMVISLSEKIYNFLADDKYS